MQPALQANLVGLALLRLLILVNERLADYALVEETLPGLLPATVFLIPNQLGAAPSRLFLLHHSSIDSSGLHPR